MLFLLSPAKSLDFASPLPQVEFSEPLWPGQSAELIGTLKKKSVKQLAALMDLSEALAKLNVQRYKDWSASPTGDHARPAMLAFNGDVYDGLDAKSLGAQDLQWAQQHVAILSGLYGVLRPLDRMQAYRLEMGTALKHGKHANLYQFWGSQIAEHLNERLAADKNPMVVNLASQEYAKSVDRKVLKARVIECVFQDEKNGQYKIISFFAKQARGMMLRHAILQRAKTPKDLKSFRLGGYAFAPEVSDDDTLVFRRPSTD